MKPLPEEDLKHILNKTHGLFKSARKKNFFMTGGTGFFGSWLLESFIRINDELGLGASITVLSRRPEAFRKDNPRFKKIKAFKFLKGEIQDFRFPRGQYQYIIHAATDNDISSSSMELFDNNIAGTRRVLDFAVRCGTEAFLFTSSGAVYGRQPSCMRRIPENYPGSPLPSNDIKSVYGESKRVSEFYCVNYSQKYDIKVKIARCFAFLGPYLPLNSNFAAGNFIRDALKGGPIYVKSNKPVYRSYLYAADLAIWLWTVLLKGKNNKPYNVGSSEPCSILKLADLTAGIFSPKLKVKIQNKPVSAKRNAEYYVPDTSLAQKELGLRQFITLREGLRRMFDFYHV